MDGNLVDLHAYRRVPKFLDDAVIGHLLAWRASLIEATNVGQDRIAFMVPASSLPGVEWLYGSRVVRADVTGPMVALAVPKQPG
jgi:hypothetical protein